MYGIISYQEQHYNDKRNVQMGQRYQSSRVADPTTAPAGTNDQIVMLLKDIKLLLQLLIVIKIICIIRK